MTYFTCAGGDVDTGTAAALVSRDQESKQNGETR